MKTLNDFKTKAKKPWEVEGVEWREVRLGEIAYIESGKRPKGGVKNYTGGIPSIGGEHLNYDGTFSFEKLKYVPESFYRQTTKGKIQKYDILIVKDGATTGKTAFVDDNFPFERAMVNEHVFLCRITNNYVYPKFIFKFLISREGQERILKTKGGTAQGGINKRFSKMVKLPLPFHNGKPDLETQKKIVEYIEENFSRIDKILEKKKKELELLDELWESVLEEAFKPKDGEEWKEVRLGEIAKEIKSGGTPSRKNKEYWENGTIPWVKIQDIPEDGYINDTEEKITEKGLNNSSAKLLPKGTILFTIFATIGRVGILNIEATTNQAIAGIILKEDYYQKYIYWALCKFGKELTLKGRGGAQNNVNITFLKNLKLLLPFRNGKPDLERQKEIANYLDNVYEKIKTLKEKIQNQITQLEEIKESILEEVFKHDK